ncbi:hypothetical protein EAKF1_ch3079c [Escherichia albertii KF1]|nr:hypothetical protein EAKF1_ch3079c [Escherichia albertii KF1]
MPGSTYQAFHQYLFIFFEFHHKTDKSHTAKNDASMHFFCWRQISVKSSP